jgi:hypothetical protein
MACFFDMAIDVAEEIYHVFIHVFMVKELVKSNRVHALHHENNLVVLYSKAT